MPIIVTVVKCKKCGSEIRSDWKFCPNCGDKIVCIGKYKELLQDCGMEIDNQVP